MVLFEVYQRFFLDEIIQRSDNKNVLRRVKVRMIVQYDFEVFTKAVGWNVYRGISSISSTRVL